MHVGWMSGFAPFALVVWYVLSMLRLTTAVDILFLLSVPPLVIAILQYEGDRKGRASSKAHQKCRIGDSFACKHYSQASCACNS
jgi:hypothetical protein